MLSFKVELKSRGKLFKENWWAPTRREWAPMLLADNQKYWVSETTAGGLPWRRLSPKYQRWKSAHYGDQPILRASGNMLDTATIKSWGDKISVKSSELGPYHQFGTKNMPARPWMGVPDLSLNRLPGLAWKNILTR